MCPTDNGTLLIRSDFLMISYWEDGDILAGPALFTPLFSRSCALSAGVGRRGRATLGRKKHNAAAGSELAAGCPAPPRPRPAPT